MKYKPYTCPKCGSTRVLCKTVEIIPSDAERESMRKRGFEKQFTVYPDHCEKCGYKW